MWISSGRLPSASLFCLLLSAGWLLLSSPDCLADVNLTDEEATELESILTTLEERSIEQAARLTEADRLLQEAQTWHEIARGSLAEAVKSSEEREKELRKVIQGRDCWRVATVATGVVGILAVVLTLAVRR